MKRQHLYELAAIVGSFRDQLSPLMYSALLFDLSDLCARANPAFDEIRFRELAAQAPLRAQANAPVAVNPLSFREPQDEGGYK